MNKYISDITLDDLIKEECKDKEFKELFEKQKVLNDLLGLIINARKEKGMTQKELADKIKTKQTAIARLESGKNGLPSLEFLYKITNALGKRLKIHFA
jgi:ribosome-binding protein aMBF1 (putative translation factor)